LESRKKWLKVKGRWSKTCKEFLANDSDWPESVVYSANFTALTVVNTLALDKERCLVKTSWAGIKLNSKARNSSAVEYVSGCNPSTYMPFSWNKKVVVHCKETV
jgi:hypothetical protein